MRRRNGSTVDQPQTGPKTVIWSKKVSLVSVPPFSSSTTTPLIYITSLHHLHFFPQLLLIPSIKRWKNSFVQKFRQFFDPFDTHFKERFSEQYKNSNQYFKLQKKVNKNSFFHDSKNDSFDGQNWNSFESIFQVKVLTLSIELLLSWTENFDDYYFDPWTGSPFKERFSVQQKKVSIKTALKFTSVQRVGKAFVCAETEFEPLKDLNSEDENKNQEERQVKHVSQTSWRNSFFLNGIQDKF